MCARPLLFLAFAAIVVFSIPAFGTRYLNDMDFYAVVADKLLAGGVLYRDALDTKPPLVFLHYALVFKLAGQNNVTAVKIVTMAWLGASALVMVAIRRALSPRAAAPVLAAPLFALASFSGWGEDFLSSGTEILANLFILAGVWCLVADDFSERALRIATGGACIGVAWLYRYQSGAALAAYIVTVLVMRRQFARPWQDMAYAAIGFLVPTAIFVGYYACIGALPDLTLLVAYQVHYARSAGEFYWLLMLAYAASAASGLIPLLVLAGWQAAAIVRKGRARSTSETFQVMFVAWSVIPFFVGGHYFPHYFIQAIPAIVLLAADRLDPARRADVSEPPTRVWLEAHALAIMTVMAAIFAAVNGAYYRTRGPDSQSARLASFVVQHSTSRDQVLLWKNRPYLLIEIHRLFATRLLSNEALIGRLDPVIRRHRATPRQRHGVMADLWPVFLRDVTAAKPRFIIDDVPGRSEWTIDRYPLLAALLAEYDPCRVIDDACVYLRKER